jgi:hypothetical protein
VPRHSDVCYLSCDTKNLGGGDTYKERRGAIDNTFELQQYVLDDTNPTLFVACFDSSLR